MKLIKRLVALLLVALVALSGFLVYRAYASKPRLDGEISDAFLKAPVRIERDEWGVPHIHAEKESDAYFALGFATAQDRLFQMELMRRIACGELAELFGSPAVPIDRVIRAFRLQPKAEEIIAAHKGEYPDIEAVADAFVAGINHAIDSEPRPLEFTLLHIPARHFTRVDCLVVAALLPITFAEGMRGDPMKSLLKEKYPNLPVDMLFPGYTLEDPPTTVMESLDEARAYLKDHPIAKPAGTPAPQAHNGDPVNALEPFLTALHTVQKFVGPTFGSNSWVLAGSRTKTGKPLLAGDPHIGMMNPGIWYEAHLVYPGMNLYGYYLPLIPLALLGHTPEHAWTITMFENDDIDVYRETFDPKDPSKVMYKGQWVDAKVEHSKIPVRCWSDADCTVRVTPHGPVITDLMRFLIDYKGPDLSLSWIWQHVDYTDLRALYGMLHAHNIDDFEKGVALITSPGLNISYADTAGNIAWWAAGRVPIRPAGLDPKIILDGASGKDEILGYLPFEQNPHLRNPPSGYIVSANNMSTVKPVGPMGTLQGYWQESDRAARMTQLLAPRHDWDLESLKAVQNDDYNEAMQRIAKEIARVLHARNAKLDTTETEALKQLETWDGRHGVTELGPTVFHLCADLIIQRGLEDEFGPKLLEQYLTLADSWHFTKYFMMHPEVPFWDDVNTPAKETRDEIFEAAFREAVKHCVKRFGADPLQWTWGRLHRITYTHPLGYLPGPSLLFNIGPMPMPGGARTIDNLEGFGIENYDIVAGPSTRRLIDLNDPAHAVSILPTGNSGYFLSPHYNDQAALYATGGYRPMHLEEQDVAAQVQHTIVCKPASLGR